MSEKHAEQRTRGSSRTYSVSEETPFTFSSISDFNCKPNRGGTGKDFFILNHWLRPNGPPDPVEAGTVNSQKTLTNRIAAVHHRATTRPRRGGGRLHRDR